jgi:hypothetical protein
MTHQNRSLTATYCQFLPAMSVQSDLEDKDMPVTVKVSNGVVMT